MVSRWLSCWGIVGCVVAGLLFGWEEARAAWDVTTATYTGTNISTSPATDPRGFWVSADGTRLFIANFSNQTIYQFSMSVGWDISTLSYDSKSYSVSSQGSPQDVALSADGTKMFMLSFYNRVVYQYTLSTPWDVSTAGYDSETISLGSANHYNFHVKRDGTKLFSDNDYLNKIQQYSLSAWDLSSEVAGTDYAYPNFSDGQELVFTMSDDGENMYIGSATNERIHWFTLSTPWDTSTATYTSSYKSISSEDSAIGKVLFNPTGTLMLATGYANDKLYEYSLDATAPTVTSLSPADGASGVVVDSTLVMTFDEVVDAESGNITVKKSDGTTVEVVDVAGGGVSGSGSTEITITLTADLEAGEDYYVQVDATAFDDSAGNSYAGISDSTTWNFSTVAVEGGLDSAVSDGGKSFVDRVLEVGSELGLHTVMRGGDGFAAESVDGSTEVVMANQSVQVMTKVPDADQVQEVYVRINGERKYLKINEDGFTFAVDLDTALPVGRYPYTVTADYGVFTLSKKGQLVVAKDEKVERLAEVSGVLFEKVWHRPAENEEGDYWLDRVLEAEKETPEQLVGAMEWQKQFGVWSDRMPGRVRALTSVVY